MAVYDMDNIRERVKRGAAVLDREIPSWREILQRFLAEEGLPQELIKTAWLEVLDSTTSVTQKSCICNINLLMIEGCKCGGK